MDTFDVISDVLYRAQFNKNLHVSLCKKLKKLYQKIDIDEFISAFNQCLLSPFKIGESNANVERTLDFSATFCVNPTLKEISNNEDEISEVEELNPLLRGVLSFLLKNHRASDSAVRFRICQFINKLLITLGDNAYLDTDLCNKMCDCMMDRLKDKAPAVRTQAVLALERLQEPTQANCPIINALLFHLNNDPSSDVRRKVLMCICRTSTTIPSILERTSDVKDDVRRVAYSTLAKIHVKSLSIKKRANVIRQGLGDRSPFARQCVEEVLLPRWLVSLDGDYLQLLHSFHVEINTKICEDVLNTFFRKKENVEQQFLDIMKSECGLEGGLIPLGKLTTEKAFLWRCFVQHCRKMNQDNLIDELIPDLTPLCAYINEFYSAENEDNRSGLSDSKRKFVILQLLEIAKDYDFSDEMGRDQLKLLVLDMIFNTDIKDEAVPYLMDRLVELEPSIIARMQILAERISELHEPIDTMDLAPSKDELESKTRDRELIEGEILNLTFQWEKSIRKQDFNEAETCKEALVGLHLRLDQMAPGHEQSESGVQMLSKFLTIIFEMMQPSNVTSLTPQLRSLMDNFVVKFITNENLKVRNLALKCMAAFCCLDLEVAKLQILVFYKELVESSYGDATCPTSLKSIFDILLVFGLEPFGLEDTLDDISTAQGKIGEMSTLLLTIIVKIIDDPTSMEMRIIAAEGFCKLALAGKIKSYTLLSKLLLTWFNPVFKSNEKMKQMLGLFFTTYTSNCDWALHTFVKAFIPTLQFLLNVDIDSPLHAIDLHNLAKLMVHLTKKGINPKVDQNVHNNLALVICNHILMDPLDDIVPVLVRALAQLELTLDDDQYVQVNDLVDQLIDVVEDKVSLRTLRRIKQNQEILHNTTKSNRLSRRESTTSQSVSAVGETDNADAANDSRIELEKIIEEMSSSQSAPSSPPPKQQKILRPQRRPLSSILDSDDSADQLPIKSVCKLAINASIVPDSGDSEDRHPTKSVRKLPVNTAIVPDSDDSEDRRPIRSVCNLPVTAAIVPDSDDSEDRRPIRSVHKLPVKAAIVLDSDDSEDSRPIRSVRKLPVNAAIVPDSDDSGDRRPIRPVHKLPVKAARVLDSDDSEDRRPTKSVRKLPGNAAIVPDSDDSGDRRHIRPVRKLPVKAAIVLDSDDSEDGRPTKSVRKLPVNAVIVLDSDEDGSTSA